MPFTSTSPLFVNPEATGSVVVLLHGPGTSGAAFASVARYLQKHLPDTCFILPSAPHCPLTWAEGKDVTAWYDLKSSEIMEDEDAEGIMQAADYLHSLLDELHLKGFRSDKTAVGGFSQGGALAFFGSLLYPHKLAGLFSLSGYFPLAGVWQEKQTEENKHTPIFIGHGTNDPVISYSNSNIRYNRLRPGREYEVRYYAMGHEIAAQELNDLYQWLEFYLAA